jgi:hypothetical protein
LGDHLRFGKIHFPLADVFSFGGCRGLESSCIWVNMVYLPAYKMTFLLSLQFSVRLLYGTCLIFYVIRQFNFSGYELGKKTLVLYSGKYIVLFHAFCGGIIYLTFERPVFACVNICSKTPIEICLYI